MRVEAMFFRGSTGKPAPMISIRQSGHRRAIKCCRAEAPPADDVKLANATSSNYIFGPLNESTRLQAEGETDLA